MQAKGSKAKLLIDFETTYGQTPATPAAVVLPFNKSSLTSKQNFIEAQTITGRRDPVVPGMGNIDVTGNIVCPLDTTAIGYLLKGAFGEPTTTGTSPYTHVYKICDSMPSLTIEQGYTDIGSYSLYNGCKISKMAFSFGGNNELTVSMDIMGAKETLGAASFASSPTTITLTRFSNFQASIQEGGSNIGNITSIDLSFEFGLDGDNYCLGGQGFRTAINEGIVKISGSLKALFENQTLLNKAVNGTESSIKINLTNGADSLEILLPEIIYERSTPGIEGPKGILLNLPYRAYYNDNIDNSAAKVTLINAKASY